MHLTQTSSTGNQATCRFMLLNKPQRIGENERPEGTVPLGGIVCFNFNHEKFIAEYLDGFLIQKTTFPVEIIVHDDGGI